MIACCITLISDDFFLNENELTDTCLFQNRFCIEAKKDAANK